MLTRNWSVNHSLMFKRIISNDSWIIRSEWTWSEVCWFQEDHSERPQEEERSVSVHAGVAERGPRDGRAHARAARHHHIRQTFRMNLEKIRSNTAVRSNSASLSAARGPVFSSGHDLKELTSARGREYHSKVFQTCSEVRGHLLYRTVCASAVK